MCFTEKNLLKHLLGLYNSTVIQRFLELLSPTLDYHEGPLGKTPINRNGNDEINSLVQQNISISKQDWDAHETSWDFETNPLLDIMNNEIMNNEQLSDNDSADDAQPIIHSSLHNYSLESLMEQYKQKWEYLFMQLHANEEELNRQFIDIYGLQDELTPDVPLDEITILQQGEISIE